MKKGIKVRFHDVAEMLELEPQVFEFHLSDKDLDVEQSFSMHFDQELAIHMPEYYKGKLIDLCSDNTQTLHHSRNESVKLIQKVVDKTHKLSKYFTGNAMVILHPGGMNIKRITDKKKIDKLRNNLAKSLGELDTHGIELLVENMPPFPWFFGGQWNCHVLLDADEIKTFCDETNYDLCFDLSHAKLYCNWAHKDLAKFLETVKPLIRHIHFADADGVDGEGLQIDEGEIDFSETLSQLSDIEMNNEITMIPEIWRGHENKGEGFKKAFERIKKHIKK